MRSIFMGLLSFVNTFDIVECIDKYQLFTAYADYGRSSEWALVQAEILLWILPLPIHKSFQLEGILIGIQMMKV
jgi:hypothetical protein